MAPLVVALYKSPSGVIVRSKFSLSDAVGGRRKYELFMYVFSESEMISRNSYYHESGFKQIPYFWLPVKLLLVANKNCKHSIQVPGNSNLYKVI